MLVRHLLSRLAGTALVAATLAACASPAAGTTTRISLLHGGLPRQYRLYVPTGHDANNAAPLVVVMHGGLGNSRQVMNSTLMNAHADRTGALVLYPDGALHTWNAGDCCSPAVRMNHDDVGFVLAAVEDAGARVKVDRARVYATGMSNGAMMSYRLACERPDVFAAVAPVGGTLMTACNPSRAIPVMHVHGEKDAFVPWNGGVGCGPSRVSMNGVDASISRVADVARCGAGTTVVSDEAGVSCVRRDGCEGDVDVVLCTVAGGGHNWPGKGPFVRPQRSFCPEDGTKNEAWDASAHIMDFLLRHRLP